MGHRSYKETVLTKGGRERKKRIEEIGWHHEHVRTGDWQGLSWILRMHAKERIFRREETRQQSELDWAKEKFEFIGKKGKTNMLYYLATKTGADFNVYIGRSLRLTPKLKGKTGEYKITYVEEDDRITISWKNKTNLANVIEAGMKNEVTGPMDISKILMDGTPEVEELRRLCRERSEGTYPPKEVEDRFMHMEEWLKPEKSTIEGAGDGLHARGKRRLKKGEIVGVYGGNIIGESDGQYTLEISREGKGSIWVDAQLGQGKYNKFGMMNEDLHRGRYSAEIGEDGFIKIIEEQIQIQLGFG